MSHLEKSSNSMPAQQEAIQLYDGTTLLGTATIAGNGWTFSTPAPLTQGTHRFTAKANNTSSEPWQITVVERNQDLVLFEPSVTEAATDGDNQRLNYYTVGSDIHVIVPTTNLAVNDTVKVYWTNPAYEGGTLVQRVQTGIQLVPFVISKYEVIDAIGSNMGIRYTVKRPPSETLHESPTQVLIVTGHTYEILSPMLSGRTLTVRRQPQFNSTSTAEVRCISGDNLDTLNSSHQTFGASNELSFTVDSEWAERNRGKAVKFNWSLRLTPSDQGYLFSRVLRVDSLA